MAVLVVTNRSDLFPVGTSVSAYTVTAAEQPAGFVRSGEPKGTKVAAATVDAAGKLELTGLAENTPYVLWANVSSTDRYLQAQVSSPQTAGAWEPLALGAKVQQRASREPHGVRREGERAQLRGQLEVKTAETLTTGETIATLPVGMRPSNPVEVPVACSGEVNVLIVATTGVITCNVTLAAAKSIKLDGISWPLT